MVSRRSLRGYVRSHRSAVPTRPFSTRPQQLGCRPLDSWAVGRGTLPALPAGGSHDRLEASQEPHRLDPPWGDRKSTRLNSSHTVISYAVFCLKKKKKK